MPVPNVIWQLEKSSGKSHLDIETTFERSQIPPLIDDVFKYQENPEGTSNAQKKEDKLLERRQQAIESW